MGFKDKDLDEFNENSSFKIEAAVRKNKLGLKINPSFLDLDLSIQTFTIEKNNGKRIDGPFKYVTFADLDPLGPPAFLFVRFSKDQAVKSQLWPVYSGSKLISGKDEVYDWIEIYSYSVQAKQLVVVTSLTDEFTQNMTMLMGGLSQRSNNVGSSVDNTVIAIPAATTTLINAATTDTNRDDTFYNSTGAICYIGGPNDDNTTGIPVQSGALFFHDDTDELYCYSVAGGNIIKKHSGRV